jgi:effector-binding domain-containing protein
MEYPVRTERVAPQLTGVVRVQASQSQLPTVVPKLCGEVWNFFRSSGLPRPGRHLALYLDCAMNIEVGVEVSQPFTGSQRVVCSQTPAGLVATTTHFGPYSRLGDAHHAVQKWCSDHGYTPAGPSWEVYGHWTDDESQLRTDVFWLLQDKAPAGP